MKLRRVTALTLGLLVSTALSGPVLAADVVPAPESYDWTGFYVGGHVGYGWIDLNGSHESESASPGEEFETGEGTFDLDDDDFLGGFQVGVNYQIDNIVLGIEGDLSFASFSDKLTNVQNESVSFDTDLVATLRARAGFAFDNLLVFGTIGAAWTDTNYQVDDGDPTPNPSGDVDLDDIGLAVGGGAEYALDERWSIKADALYMIFDDKEKTQNLTDDSEVGDFIELEDLFVVRVGINFHL
jgi:outer membrane immunogenic protein